jgi:hypothetical protein
MRRGTRGLFRSSRAILKISSGRLPSASTPRRFSSTLASATICSIFVSGRLGASGMAIQRICAHGRHVSSSIGARHNQTGPLPRGWYRRPRRYGISLGLLYTWRRAFQAERIGAENSAPRPAFLYIDEAAEYFDDHIDDLLTQARKHNLGVVFSHQYLDQLTPSLRSSIAARGSARYPHAVKTSEGVRYVIVRGIFGATPSRVPICETIVVGRIGGDRSI